MNGHINDYEQSYIEYMAFNRANLIEIVLKMTLNTCKVIIRNADQTTIIKGVLCASDTEL